MIDAEAEDVAQDVFLALLRRTDAFDAARGSLGAYLFGIARHHVLKRLAVRSAESPLDADEGGAQAFAAPTQENPFEGSSREETIRRVRAAVMTLPVVYREVVVLCELQEMDLASAAEMLECPLGTVKSRLHRARAMLMAKLAAMQQPAVGSGWSV